jgi:hypothetical protein
MITWAAVAKVTAVSLDRLTLETFGTRETIEGQASQKLLFDVQVGMEGVFVGEVRQGRMYEIKFVEPRRLLKPLYEEDLFAASGDSTFISVIGDPFFEAYKKLEGQQFLDPAFAQLTTADLEPATDITSDEDQEEDADGEE